MKKLIPLIVIILISGCTTIEYITVPLDTPPKLVLPVVPKDSLSCISDSAFSILVKRDKLQAERINTLTGIIETTQ